MGPAPLILMVSILALFGCSRTPAPTDSGGQPGESVSVRPYDPKASVSTGAPVQQLLPIQSYMMRGRDYDTVMRANTILAQKCMDGLGFTVKLPQPNPASGVALDITYRRYGIQSLPGAQNYGYRDPSDVAGPVPGQQVVLTQAERVALGGAQLPKAGARYRNGCLGEADRKLMGDASVIVVSGITKAPIVNEVDSDPRSVDSPKEKEALAKFKQCMADAGYPDITDPRDSPDISVQGAKAGQAEIAEAVTHFGCQGSSGVTQAMRDAEVAFQLAAVDANPEAFAQIKAEIAYVVRTATTIVQGG